jgi:diguanylate cyclase (GGDEF)-like protein
MTEPLLAPDAPSARTPTSRTALADRGVVVLTVVQVLAAAALVLTNGETSDHLAGPWGFVAIAAAFFVVEYFVFHVELRRETMSFSLSEVPLAFALEFLAPGSAVLARLLGSVPAYVLSSRPTVRKATFNAANWAAETALASFVVHAIAGGHGNGEPVLLLFAIVPAIAIATAASSLVVVVVVSLYEGGLGERLRSEVGGILVSGLVMATVAAVAVTPAHLDARLVPMAVIPCAAFWFFARANGGLAQANRDLEDMHSFSRSVGGSLDPRTIAEQAADEIGRMLRAGMVRVVVLDPETGAERFRRGSAELDAALPVDADALAALLSWADPCVLHPGDRGATVEQLVVVSVQDDGLLLGAVAIAGREGGVADRFEDADVRRLAALGDQLATILRRAQLHEELERSALLDDLTGLPNRVQLERAIDARLADPDGPPMSAVVLLDLDRFAEVNEALGHVAGDQVLREVAQRLRVVCGPGDVAARIGADQFALLVGCGTANDVIAVAGAVGAALRAPVEVEGIALAAVASMGIVVIGRHGEDVVTLLRRAEIALHHAKTSQAQWTLYDPAIDRSSVDRLGMADELRQAIEGGELELHYQPKLDLRTGTIVGAEGLMRWMHPTRGIVPPDEFVPLAERTGLIVGLTAVALDQALATARDLVAAGYHLRLAVNLSALNLADDLLPDRVARALEQHDVSPGLLTLEITEGSMMADAERAIAVLRRLDDLGVELSVDDFGTGYSSLSYLRRLPVGELKIDRSFVLAMSTEDDTIVRSTIDLGHNLGLKVVAEGVEDDATAEHLVALGCDLAQGYGIARPMARQAFVAFLGSTRFGVRRVADAAAEGAPIHLS